MQFILSSALARAIDLRACARYRRAPADAPAQLYAVEGHDKHGQFIFLCGRELIPLLVAELERHAARYESATERARCLAAARDLERQLEENLKPVAKSTQTDLERGHLGM